MYGGIWVVGRHHLLFFFIFVLPSLWRWNDVLPVISQTKPQRLNYIQKVLLLCMCHESRDPNLQAYMSSFCLHGVNVTPY